MPPAYLPDLPPGFFYFWDGDYVDLICAADVSRIIWHDGKKEVHIQFKAANKGVYSRTEKFGDVTARFLAALSSTE